MKWPMRTAMNQQETMQTVFAFGLLELFTATYITAAKNIPKQRINKKILQ